MEITINTRAEATELAANACHNSEKLTTKALDWVVDHTDRHPGLADLIVSFYVESPEFATWVVDVADGMDEA
jgi:hypothetical protein